MKRLLLAAGMILITGLSFAQLENKGNPLSWKGKLEQNKDFDVKVMPGFDMRQVAMEDSINDANKVGPWRFGYNFDVDYSLENSGVWQELPNGGKLWILEITSPGALTMNLIFDDYHLPEGAYILTYNNDRSHLVGAYTSILNNDDRTIGSELVDGDHIIIEYYEPADVVGQGSLKIGTVTHGYRSLQRKAEELARGLNDSGPCNIDVDCPLGIGWEQQIQSVAMIVSGGNGMCTGGLVNNTLEDKTPYFLTADHCLGNPANWVFRFNWHSDNPSCATTANSGNGGYDQTAFNGTLRANNAGSDFALVEINNQIPDDWSPFYAGWDRTDVAPDYTVGVHHPSGDIKKICMDEDPPYHETQGGAEVWWIDQWEHGVTEPGSSGSPLFDNQGRVIGQLYGGTAACSGTSNNGGYDFYGRFATSWDGSNASNRLRDWLDPNNSGTQILDGYDPNASQLELDAQFVSFGNIENVICGTTVSPQVTIRNNGTTTLTSLDIVYELNTDGTQTINWTGSLEQNEAETVNLGSMNVSEGTNELVVMLENPNGDTDEDPSNNSGSIEFEAFTDGQLVTLHLQTDCYGDETTWDIRDDEDNILYVGGPYPGTVGAPEPEGTLNVYEICLSPNDCYEFNIYDSFGDGMNCSDCENCSIDGYYFIEDMNGNLLVEMEAENADFGTQATHDFCVPDYTSVPENNLQNIKLYPNPTNDKVFLEHRETGQLNVQIFDMGGRIMDNLLLNGNSRYEIEMSRYSNGIYFIHISSNKGTHVEKISVVK